jgi:hypothetical protein
LTTPNTPEDFSALTVGALHSHILQDEQIDLRECPLVKLIWVANYDIRNYKGLQISPHLAPYMDAFLALPSDATMSTRYGMENAGGMIGYFLNNATTWRGGVARAIKKELVSRHKAWLANGMEGH